MIFHWGGNRQGNRFSDYWLRSKCWVCCQHIYLGLGCGHFGIHSTVELCRFCVLSLHWEVGSVRQYTWLGQRCIPLRAVGQPLPWPLLLVNRRQGNPRPGPVDEHQCLTRQCPISARQQLSRLLEFDLKLTGIHYLGPSHRAYSGINDCLEARI